MDRSDINQKRLETHLAEYNALTTRITYWVTLLYGTYAIAAGALGVFLQGWRSLAPLTLAGGGLLAVQVVTWAVLHVTFEMFTCVIYIKETLKPQMQPLLNGAEPPGDYPFWGFEPFLNDLRKPKFSRFEWQFGLSGPIVLGICIAVWEIARNASPFCTRSNCVWLVLNCYVFAMTTLKFYYAWGLKKRAAK